jgi:small-conductance mechanosensitive channel
VINAGSRIRGPAFFYALLFLVSLFILWYYFYAVEKLCPIAKYKRQHREDKPMNSSIIIQIAVIIIVWVIAMQAINKVFAMILSRNDQIHIKFLRSMSQAGCTLLAGILLSGLFPATKTLSTTLLTSSSLLVAILGLAGQQVLADVVSGLILSWFRPFNVGERISLNGSGITGVVEDMTIRHTIIRTFYNSRLVIPNSVISKEILENSNLGNDYIGSYLTVSISYESDVEKAMEIMREVIENHPSVIDIRKDKSVGTKATVFLTNLGDSGVDLRATIWTATPDENFPACCDIRLEIKKRFEAENISIPYPHVHLVTDSPSQNEGDMV